MRRRLFNDAQYHLLEEVIARKPKEDEQPIIFTTVPVNIFKPSVLTNKTARMWEMALDHLVDRMLKGPNG